MHSEEYYRTNDFRWTNRETTEKSTWRETLASMAEYFGTFCGRWHDNEFWRKQATEVTTMTEEQAEERVRQIERNADRELAMWQMYQ